VAVVQYTYTHNAENTIKIHITTQKLGRKQKNRRKDRSDGKKTKRT
jgi:hypothetical protein